MEKTLHPF